eukprot:XP_015584028.1 uncharacterized protein LOC8280799 isoform X1 [Ricinus communis]
MATIDFHLLPIFALFCVMVSGSKASLPAEDYWHSKLPNTPIPQELLKLLHPADLGGNNTFWNMSSNEAKNLWYFDSIPRYSIYYKAFMEDMDNAKSKYGKHYDIEGLDDSFSTKRTRIFSMSIYGMGHHTCRYSKD